MPRAPRAPATAALGLCAPSRESLWLPYVSDPSL
jgi:hypothetical protein